MAEWITFYEKPGCSSNSKQKRLLQQAGVPLIIRNLLLEPWTPLRLAPFFEHLPVAQWFNPAAPRIKNGDVAPERFTAEEALLAMIDDPFLIRRPLIESRGFRTAGFDWDFLAEALSLGHSLPDVPENIEKCSHPNAGHRCRQEA